MERMFRKVFSLTVLLSTGAMIAQGAVLPYLNFRSPGRDNVRKLVGTTSHHVYLYDMDSFYGSFSIIPAYERSFRGRHIAECLFGGDLRSTNNDCEDSCKDGRTIVVSGSQSPGRDNDRDWMAENFYLARDFQSTLEFRPRIQNIILDFQFYAGLDEWRKGLYFRLYGPVVNARYNLRFCEKNVETGAIGYQEGFFNPDTVAANSPDNAVPVANLLQSATAYFGGNSPEINGVTTQGLKFARMCPGKLTETCFSDLRFELGWNPWLEEDHVFGFGLEFAAPTGKRPEACFLFEPQCGNGKHWEVGGNVHGIWTMWRSEDEERHWDFVLEADITHMFNAKQKRTFDLEGKPLSRYMLAEKMGTPVENDLQGADAAGGGAAGAIPNLQFQREYAPVANFSTRDIKVRSSVQADLVAMFDFTVRGFSWDIGYNFWARSCEKIKFRDDCDDSCGTSGSFPENTWALKGDSYVIGFLGAIDGALNADDPINLSATQSKATINAGTNFNAPDPGDGAGTDPSRNPGIDGTKPAVAGAANTIVAFAPIAGAGTNDAAGQTRTSIQPVTITQSDLDCSGARSKGISHKVFTHFNYTCVDREDWIPYVGVGVSAEFGKRDSQFKSDCPTDSSNCDTNCDSCSDCGLSKWAVWAKFGLSFN